LQQNIQLGGQQAKQKKINLKEFLNDLKKILDKILGG